MVGVQHELKNASEMHQPDIEIKASIAKRISFATYQNHLPVIADLEVKNLSEKRFEKLKLVLECKPAIISSKTWRIDQLSPKGSLPITGLDVSIEGGLLSELNERMRATVTLTVLKGTKVLASFNHDLIGLARNEWVGANTMPEILAAFVLANDRAVSKILTGTSETLRRAGVPPAIEGYQSKSRRRVWQIVAAIWATISSLRLNYAQPPPSFELQGQKIRTPQQIMDEQLATCLDLAVLFAAAIEQAGLYPLIVLSEGHAMCGVWLQPQLLPALTTDDSTDLRKSISLQELIIFETTLVTQTFTVSLAQAIEAAKPEISEKNQDKFIYALDIKRARGQQITPLHSESTLPKKAETDSENDFSQALEIAPDLPGFDFGIDEGPPPDSPETRLDHWKRKLLDMTKRNRLLNLKLTKTAIRFICSNPALLEDKLASGKKITIIPSLKNTEGMELRDQHLFHQRTGKELLQEYANEAIARNEVVADLPDTALKSSLIQLYRKANTDLQEGGANTLFLALGLLRWKQSPQEKRSYQAPLILLPVKLQRKSAISKIKLYLHEDPPVFNMTLLEMLRQDFQLEIPELNGALPKDDSGIDVSLIWDIVRKAIRDISGFEVLEHIVISTFSFAKFLMWKDLSDRTEILKKSPFVKHLIDSPREPYPNSAPFLQPNQIDKKIDPAELYLPLPADSSQIVAVHASAQAGDFILEGPPGTGKSQTISNIIAHNLGLGRRVLFVSEKMAALDVVHRRLREIGLGEFCLELHSHKANKRAVLDQLGRSLKNREQRSPAEWEAEAEKLKETRDKLNHFVHTLHQPGATGVSPRAAMGRVAKWGHIHKLRLDWGPSLANDFAGDRAGLERLSETVDRLAQSFSEIDDQIQATFSDIAQETWSKAWENRFVAHSKELDLAIQSSLRSSRELAKLLGLPAPNTQLQHLKGLSKIAYCLPTAASSPLGFALEKDGSAALAAFEKALIYLKEYRDKKASFGAVIDDDTALNAPLDLWANQWARATTAWWPLRIFKTKGLKRDIQTHFQLQTEVDPNTFIPFLKSLRKIRNNMDSVSQGLSPNTPWRGLDTPIELAKECIQTCQIFTKGIAQFSENLDQHNLVHAAIRRIATDGRELIQPEMPIALMAKQQQEDLAQFEKAYASYCEDRHRAPILAEDLEGLLARVREIIQLRPRLNAWCRWQAVCNEARNSGLKVFIDAIKEGQLTTKNARDTFVTAYHAWLADCLIDSEDVLRTFSASDHAQTIQKFRKLDQNLAQLSVDFIRAKLKGNVPNLEGKKLPPGYGVLAHELQKRMRHIPVRKLIAEMGEALTTLTPCILMSPLSISQYLAADDQLFDLVVFDEASQITVWDAIGAIARGKTVIVVGDPKQMPPSNFFGRNTADENDDVSENMKDDLESILDEALAAKIKCHRLSGHYRSRHESLIAFSNHRYYSGDLITFPSAETRDTAVSFQYVDGLYQRGKNRTNPIEAQAVVAAVLARLKDPLTQNQSLGIVTFNSDQQRIIDDLLDQARRDDPDLEPFFSNDLEEPVFVKNLETVQGDQRDVIFLSVGFGPDTPGAKRMSMNFGPLNRKGGERRLNVAITRATTEMVIFCSFDPSMIDLTRTSATAVKDLKHYLEFAQRGPKALGEAVLNFATDQYDSDFEAAVAEKLRTAGWTVHTQIGVSKFRIDLGIVHPDFPGQYLAGVECDGATYHRSPSARDRDRVRHAVLENLKWNLVRIWSTDFFIDPKMTMSRVNQQLKNLLLEDRKQRQADSNPEQPDHLPAPETGDSSKIQPAEELPKPSLPDPPSEPKEDSLPTLFTKLPAPKNPVILDRSQIFEPQSLPLVREKCLSMVDALGPITFPHLCEKLARSYQLDPVTGELKSLVKQALGSERAHSKTSKQAAVIWPKDTKPVPVYSFRGFTVAGAKRKWQHIPYPEKLGLVASTLEKSPQEDPIVAICSRLKLKTPISAKTQDMLQNLINALQAVRSRQAEDP